MKLSKEQIEKVKYQAYLLLRAKNDLKKGDLLEREEREEDYNNSLTYFDTVCHFLKITFDIGKEDITIGGTNFMYVLALKSAQKFVDKYLDKIYKN